MDAPTPSPEIPDYELIRPIGRGSYGEVWLARAVTGVFRALKIVWRDRFEDPRPYEREFAGITEFAAVSLREPSQLALLHVGRDPAGRFFYYVMELADDVVRGREIDPVDYQPLTLREHRTRAPLPAAEVIDLGAQLARALATLHSRRLVHRDVKPSNIVFVGGVPKLADLGLVTAARSEMTFVGTEGFVPPEGPGAPGADVFSLGRVLYELATGHDRGLWPRLPAEFGSKAERRAFFELNEVLLRACASDADDRFADAAGMLDELLLLQAGKSVRRLRAAERRLGRALRVAAVLAVAAAVTGTGMWLERQRAGRETALRRRAEAELQALTQRTLYSATLAQAQQAIAQENFGQARALLESDAARPPAGEARGTEWSVLAAQAAGDPCTLLHTGKPGIRRMVRSPRWIAAVDGADDLFLIDPVRGSSRPRARGIARFGGFSHDGKSLVVQERKDGRVVRLAVEGDAPPVPLPAPPKMRLLGLDPDDNLVGILDETARAIVICEQGGGQIVRRFEVAAMPGDPTWDLSQVCFSRTGERAAAAFLQSRGAVVKWRVLLLNLAQRRVVWDGTPPGLHVYALGVLDSEPSWILAASESGELHKLSESDADWRRVREFGAHLRLLVESAQLPGVVLGTGPTAELFACDLANPDFVWRRRGHTAPVEVLLPGDGQTMVYSGANDGTVRGWPVELHGTTRGWQGRAVTGGEICLVPSPDGTRLLAAQNNGQSAMLAAGTWQPAAGQPALPHGIAWAGDRLWTLGAGQKSVERWRLTDDDARLLEQRHETPDRAALLHATVSPDGAWLVAGDSGGTLSVWPRDSASPSHTVTAHRDATWGFAFDAGRGVVWSAGNDRTLVAVELATGRIAEHTTLRSLVQRPAVSPDGRTLALACTDGRLEFRSAETGALQRETQVSAGATTCATFTADGTRLLVGDSNGMIHFVRVRDASIVTSIRAVPSDQVKSVELAPTGRWLAIETATGRVLRWDLAPPPP